ncbi:hypothetical protein I5Q34_17130 [Streptomyces sp. AV19]|nr:hypothetical protein [Streptomyces sp. AV19]MBH1935970.1 hypothetical protein [Streptomyces sp. AV19]
MDAEFVPRDTDAARRRAAARAGRVAAGASELEQRLADLLHGGFASSAQAGRGPWEETAARMIDAQAPGLAAQARELGATTGAGADWAARLLERCALLHTLNRAYLRVDRLPEGLAATVRGRVGITVDTAALASSAPPVRDHWLVLSQRDGGDGRLVTRRIWLHGRETGRAALLLSYGAGGRAPELSLTTGLELEAELLFHPAARPLRAVLADRHAPPAPRAAPPPGGDTAAALRAYGEALRDDPWLESWPVVLRDVIPVPDPRLGWQLADARGDSAISVDARCDDRRGLWQLAAVSGGEPVTVFGECGHRGFLPLAVWGEELVPLQV